MAPPKTIELTPSRAIDLSIEGFDAEQVALNRHKANRKKQKRRDQRLEKAAAPFNLGSESNSQPAEKDFEL